MGHLLNIIKYFLLLILICPIYILSVRAIDIDNHIEIVYPKNNAIINANSTFFVGNTNPNAQLTINNEPVKVYSNGGFVKVHKLKKGENSIILQSVFKKHIVTKQLKVVVPKMQSIKKDEISEFLNEEKFLYVDKDEIPLRKTPYGERLTPQKKGCIVKSVGMINNYYKVLLDDNYYGYIAIKDLEECPLQYINKQIIENINISEGPKDIYINIKLKQSTPILIENIQNKLSVRIINSVFDVKNFLNKSSYIKNVNTDDNRLDIEFNMKNLNGYDYSFSENNLILKIKKPFSKGLKGKIIVIDAGHGGNEFGAVGPTNIKEKEINLEISKYLKTELEKAGAKVIMIRHNDKFVDLYERVEIAKKKQADIMISIHNNSLPDGENPYVTHGTTTYYYHDQAIPLANNIQYNLLKTTKFKDLGIKKGSFVLVRPSYPISVLVEIGFMINPYEYEKITDPKYQKKYAVGIKNGVEAYLNDN